MQSKPYGYSAIGAQLALTTCDTTPRRPRRADWTRVGAPPCLHAANQCHAPQGSGL